MTTVHRDDARGRIIAFTKGAVDVMLPRCTQHPDETARCAPSPSEDNKDIMAAAGADGTRTRCAYWRWRRSWMTTARQKKDLTFVGLVGMIDPPRPEARDAVESFKRAGIRTVMITGDHRDTAFAIARRAGHRRKR